MSNRPSHKLCRGDYIVVFDPLDGSSNIDCGVSGALCLVESRAAAVHGGSRPCCLFSSVCWRCLQHPHIIKPQQPRALNPAALGTVLEPTRPTTLPARDPQPAIPVDSCCSGHHLRHLQSQEPRLWQLLARGRHAGEGQYSCSTVAVPHGLRAGWEGAPALLLPLPLPPYRGSCRRRRRRCAALRHLISYNRTLLHLVRVLSSSCCSPARRWWPRGTACTVPCPT